MKMKKEREKNKRKRKRKKKNQMIIVARIKKGKSTPSMSTKRDVSLTQPHCQVRAGEKNDTNGDYLSSQRNFDRLNGVLSVVVNHLHPHPPLVSRAE